MQERLKAVEERRDSDEQRVVIDLTTRTPRRPDLSYELAITISLKVLVPVIALLETAVIFGLVAALLYSVPETATTEVAIATGVGLVLATAAVSRHRTFTKAIFGEIAVLTIYPLIITIVLVHLGG